MTVTPSPESNPVDLTTRILKWGLVALVMLAPLPFGAVTATGRGGLEIGALVLGLIWTAHAALRGTGLPPASARLGARGVHHGRAANATKCDG